jgi:hypothetical protein
LQISRSLLLKAALLIVLSGGMHAFRGQSHAQSWDWIRGNDFPWFSLNNSWHDSAANIFSCVALQSLPDSSIVRHSKKFSDTFYNPKGTYPPYYNLLVKSNRSGRFLWKLVYYGDVVDIAFKDGHIYVLSRVPTYNDHLFTFGKSTISETKLPGFSQTCYYYVHKISQAGQAIEVNRIMELNRKVKINNFLVHNDGQMLLYIQRLSGSGTNPQNNMIFKDSIPFLNINIDNFTFLLSLDMHNGLNWIRCCGYTQFEVTENGHNRLEFDGTTISTLEYDENPKVNRMYFRKYNLQGSMLYEKELNIHRNNWFVGIKSDNEGNYYCYGSTYDSCVFDQKVIHRASNNNVLYKFNNDFILQSFWLPDARSVGYYNFCIDRKGKVYIPLMFLDSMQFGSQKLYGVLRSNGIQTLRYVIVNLDQQLKPVKVYDLPGDGLHNFYKVWTDRYDNLYAEGTLESDRLIQTNIDGFTLDASKYNNCPFQARLNLQKLKLRNKILYCSNDSLGLDADTIYKWFEWRINDTLVRYGSKARPVVSEGWHKVVIRGYEIDSTMTEADDSFYFTPPPTAVLIPAADKVCRYSKIKFSDKSLLSSYHRNIVNANIDFGDNTDSTVRFRPSDKPRIDMTHVYSQTGKITITYSIEHAGCRDTQILKQVLSVIESPTPGFSVSAVSGCAPLEIIISDTVTLNVKSKDYYFSDSALWKNMDIRKPAFRHSFAKPGVYRIVQALSGFTGCVTRTDSVFIHVSKGLGTKDSLHVYNSTVMDGKALVYWRPLNGATAYEIYRDRQKLSAVTDSFYHDAELYLRNATYDVRGVDSCGNLGSHGRTGKPVFLAGKMTGYNGGARLAHSAYREWPVTDIRYRIQKLQTGNPGSSIWKNLRESADTLVFDDPDFFEEGKTGATYRVEAYSLSRPDLVTHSNIVHIPYIPVLYLPTAFSPDGDGINELYKPVIYGIEYYRLTVCNRWGEILFKGEDNQPWQATVIPQGVYAVMIEYLTNEGQLLKQRTLVTLLR